jgi:hypothetical protein
LNRPGVKRNPSGVPLEDGKTLSGHRQAEDGFQDNQPSRPGVERLEPGQTSEESPVLDRIDNGDRVCHKMKKACEVKSQRANRAP